MEQSNYDYYSSLIKDILKDISRQRIVDRFNVEQILSSQYPTNLEDTLLTPQKRLMTLYSNPKFRSQLNSQELHEAEGINKRFEKYRMGYGYNLPLYYQDQLIRENKFYSICIAALPFSFSWNIDTILNQNNIYYRDNILYIDLMLPLPGDKKIRYPLNDSDAKNLRDKLVDMNRYHNDNMYPNLTRALNEINNIKKRLS